MIERMVLIGRLAGMESYGWRKQKTPQMRHVTLEVRRGILAMSVVKFGSLNSSYQQRLRENEMKSDYKTFSQP
ncbi:MAG: hypothetical protein K8T91_08350 [Planctomycetes bacterium]|nr:hypothetical protein [Planctomycetota bacterium]